MLSYLVSRPGQKPLEALRRDPGLGLELLLPLPPSPLFLLYVLLRL